MVSYNIYFIILSKYSSSGEAIFIGLIQGAFIALLLWGISKIRKSKKK